MASAWRRKKLPCELKEILRFLEPYKNTAGAGRRGIDLQLVLAGRRSAGAEGYPVVLANPAKMEQYSGIKHADDTNDAFFSSGPAAPGHSAHRPYL